MKNASTPITTQPLEAILVKGLRGLFASVHRVLEKAEGSHREYLLHIISGFQQRLLAIDAHGIGKNFHVLPLLPTSIDDEKILAELSGAKIHIREKFRQTCFGLDHSWCAALDLLPREISIHALG